MATQLELVDALLTSGSYRGLRALLPVLDLPAQRRTTAQALCDFALSVLDVDAEDWNAFPDVPEDLRRAVAAAHIPQDPHDHHRGALESLVPAFAIMLEVAAVRHRQGDRAGVLVVCHILSEYLPMLAWEPHLGHAADPARMADDVTRPGSLWGVDRAEPGGHECAHSPSTRGSLREVVRAGRPAKEWSEAEYERIWRTYFDRDHSRVSAALATCGLIEADGRPRPLRACAHKCTVWSELAGDRADLADRLAIAGMFVESPLIALRHAAPIGHGFGVPSPSELARAWEKTWVTMTAPWTGRRNPLTGTGPGEVLELLAGLAAMTSAVAGRPIEPTAIFSDVDARIRSALV